FNSPTLTRRRGVRRRCWRRARRRLTRRSAGMSLDGLFFGFSFFAWDRLLRIVALRPLHDSGGIEKTHDAVGRLRALGHPGLGLVQIELQPLGFVFRQ